MFSRWLVSAALVVAVAGCGDAPTAPSGLNISGSWSGTVELTSRGQTIVGSTTWIFDGVPRAAANTAHHVTIHASHPWFPVVSAATSAQLPGNYLSTDGRGELRPGCAMSFGSSSTQPITAHTIEGDFSAVDLCESRTFTGHVSLSR